jgi:hypothetical protein
MTVMLSPSVCERIYASKTAHAEVGNEGGMRDLVCSSIMLENVFEFIIIMLVRPVCN